VKGALGVPKKNQNQKANQYVISQFGERPPRGGLSLRIVCLCCRSERIPGRLRCEFEVADVGAEPQSNT
jgi:hypothetical protein